MVLSRPVRRLLAPVLLAAELVLLGLFAVLAMLGGLSVVLDRKARILRLAVMTVIYIGLELAGLAAFFGTWLLRPARGREWALRREQATLSWVLDRVISASGRLLGFRVELEEPSSRYPFDTAGPVLVVARHGGIGDSFALVWLLSSRYLRRPRIVVKDVLLWDPFIDVALTRMGACWVSHRRGSPRQHAQVAATAAAIGPGDALLIFPEGGNWTPRRRLRAMARLWRSGQPQALKAAALMQHVLAPRAGGVLAAFDARPDLPVVVMAHTGLDEVTSPAELWRALPFRSPMRLRWWPAAPVPGDEAARVEWLTAEWAVIDEWIDAARQVAGP